MASLPDYVLAVLLPQAFDGLIIASALILVAVGLTMIFGLLHVINLAHGELYMLGAYGAYALMRAGAPFWLALLASPLLVGTLGLLIERLGVRPLMRRKDRAVLTLLLTFGLGLMLRDADLAADALDEAMVRAYQRWRQVSRLDNPRGWVYRGALNYARSRLRRLRRRPPSEAETQEVMFADPSVAAAIANLSLDHRSVVVCRYLLG
ncbi:MAG: hypothetical protein H7Z19_13915, partial [Chitinophagaceae bacterium]|nr:hypothetical protein [Rubrivivax sp.]